MNKNTQLDKEERAILKEYEQGVSKSVPNIDNEIRYFKEVAKKSTARTKSINLRLSPRDLHRIKVKAAAEGIPYQTLLSSLIHKYATKSQS
ncbi:antitoxin [Candidatus Pacebacteria bacterium]|nr:antitoxin [Candidatus Paceibacterota bacterium]